MLYRLIVIMCVRFAVSSAWETAGVGILVYTMGPLKSRSLVMCHHFVIALGFLVGPMLIKPFFPAEAEASHERVCDNNAGNEKSDDSIADFDSLKYPYYILTVGHFICALGYILVIITPYIMPGKFRIGMGGFRAFFITLVSSTSGYSAQLPG